MSSCTLGIDLASQPRDTAACVLDWSGDRATVEGLHTDLGDPDLLDLVEDKRVTKAAIDAPFGWPLGFVRAVNGYARTGTWPATEPRLLTLRETDRWVRDITGRDPLSVSTDKISFTAMRCARLLTEYASRWGPVDRSGVGRLVEVYPAAALRQWGLNARGYKGVRPEQTELRDALVEAFARAAKGWLTLRASDITACRGSDHLLDALVAAVVARTAELGHALPIPPECVDVARREGWISLPERESLDVL